MAIATLAMRRILISYARKRHAEKRGGKETLVTFTDGMAACQVNTEELIDLDDALEKLEMMNERQARVVQIQRCVSVFPPSSTSRSLFSGSLTARVSVVLDSGNSSVSPPRAITSLKVWESSMGSGPVVDPPSLQDVNAASMTTRIREGTLLAYLLHIEYLFRLFIIVKFN